MSVETGLTKYDSATVHRLHIEGALFYKYLWLHTPRTRYHTAVPPALPIIGWLATRGPRSRGEKPEECGIRGGRDA